jgi:hypothetical protein
MKGLICPQKSYAFLSQIFVQNDRKFFFKETKLKKMLPNTLSMNVVLKKITKITFVDCVLS